MDSITETELEELIEQYPEIAEIVRIDREHDNQVMCLYDFNEPVFGDLELRAQWDANSYVVRFHDGDQTLDEYEQDVLWGKCAETPDEPYRFGYTFVGWFREPELVHAYDFSAPVKTDLDLYAAFEINTYAVTFDSAGGSKVESQGVAHGGKAMRPDDPTREGYSFDGWYVAIGVDDASRDGGVRAEAEVETAAEGQTGDEEPFDFDQMQILINTTLRAHWVAKDSSGGTNKSTDTTPESPKTSSGGTAAAASATPAKATTQAPIPHP